MPVTLASGNFSLTLELHILENHPSHPVNSVLNVSVASGDFAGAACLDIDAEDFAAFCAALASLYEQLSGEAVISEPYGRNMYLAFRGDGRGHISVSGMLCDFTHTLEFENEIDQTALGRFQKELRGQLKKG